MILNNFFYFSGDVEQAQGLMTLCDKLKVIETLNLVNNISKI